MKDFFDTVKTATGKLYPTRSTNRFRSNIAIGPANKSSALLSTYNLKRLYAETLDENYPHQWITKAITGGADIAPEDHPFLVAWNYRGIAGKMAGIIKFGPLDATGKNKVGRGIEQILSEVPENDLADFRDYYTAKHVLELLDIDIYTGFERKDAEHIMNKFSNKGWDSIIDEAVDYQNKVMRQLVYSGIMSQETYDNIVSKYKYYLPMHVLMDEKNMPKLGKSMEARDPIYRIKGHSENTIDPFESIIKNTIVYTAMAEQNMVGRAYLRLAKNYDGTGKFFDIVPPRMIGKSFQIGEIEKSATRCWCRYR